MARLSVFNWTTLNMIHLTMSEILQYIYRLVFSSFQKHFNPVWWSHYELRSNVCHMVLIFYNLESTNYKYSFKGERGSSSDDVYVARLLVKRAKKTASNCVWVIDCGFSIIIKIERPLLKYSMHTNLLFMLTMFKCFILIGWKFTCTSKRNGYGGTDERRPSLIRPIRTSKMLIF